MRSHPIAYALRPRPFGIGIENPKYGVNVGTLWRSAVGFGASFVFTIGRRYKRQASDTVNTPSRIPVFYFSTLERYRESAAFDWIPIAVELAEGAGSLVTFVHPEKCVYILGPEDSSISKAAQRMCKYTVRIPSCGCLNLAVAGSIIMYDRIAKGAHDVQ